MHDTLSDDMPAKKPGNHTGGIGTLNEKPLHAALRGWYVRPRDRFEVEVDGSLIDIVRGKRLIEIQTGHFAPLKRKLGKLVKKHRVRLVYPIAQDKWVVRVSKNGKRQLSCRKSPKHGSIENVFDELVSIPNLVAEKNFSLEVLMIQEEEVRRQGVSRSWRRGGWGTHERRLLAVLDRWVFETPADFADLLPEDLPEPFSTADVAAGLGKPRPIAQRMAYCLREMGAIRIADKRGNALLYTRSPA